MNQEKETLETEVNELRQKFAEPKTVHASDLVSLKTFEEKHHELQTEVDRLTCMRVDHTEVDVIKEQSAELDQLKNTHEKLQKVYDLSRQELQMTYDMLEQGKVYIRKLRDEVKALKKEEGGVFDIVIFFTFICVYLNYLLFSFKVIIFSILLK